MKRHLFDTALKRKQAGLWTPWGPQRVPDLDKALDGDRSRARRREDKPSRKPQGERFDSAEQPAG